MYAKIVNEETKQCEVGTGTNTAFYKSIGMSEMEVEQAYNGQWYLKGYSPEKPVEEKEAEARAVRNQYLSDTDKYMIPDFPITEEERQQCKDYRKYLRNYPETENWYEQNPLTFEEWKESQTPITEEPHVPTMGEVYGAV